MNLVAYKMSFVSVSGKKLDAVYLFLCEVIIQLLLLSERAHVP
jgi:hypothetical protein